MQPLKFLHHPLIIFVFIFPGIFDAVAANTDPNLAWPLCGRISENPPNGWVDTEGCPPSRFGDPNFSDEPLSSTFGPRPLASENNRYDFHRGIDIATPIGSPFFAIADGTVEIAGNHSSYSDPLVKLRHFRPGETNCNAGGCYHSFYLHIDTWVVNENDQVVKGQLLGYTGASHSGFEHMHFEIRDAPDFDVFSAWSRDAIHPLSVLPYSVPNNTTIQFNAVDFSNPAAGNVDLTVTSNRYDLVRLDLTILDANQQPLVQPGNTPNGNGYYVLPSFFDMELWNFQYSHKNSTVFPWSSFGASGVNECPFHSDHGTSYNPNIHMDQQDPVDLHKGLFNGVHVRTQKYWPSDVSDYTVDLEFQALEGAASCVQATALFASGDAAFSEWGNCSGAPNQSPTASMTWDCQGSDCNFDGQSSFDPDGSIMTYNWDFGDGNSAVGNASSNAYTTSGSYSVTLTVTDNEGAADSVVETVSVTEAQLIRGPYLQMQTETGITIYWRTNVATDSVVRYGTSVDSLNDSVVVSGLRTDHAVELTGLNSYQNYWYTVGDSVAEIAGDSTYHFSTAPSQSTSVDTRILVLGDSGTANADARAVRDGYKTWSGSNPAHLLLMLGDNAYNDGTDAEYQAAVFDTYPEILRQIPVFSTLGNHDGHTADSDTQTGPYYDIFNLPRNGEIGGLASGTEAYYSFDYANIHFVCLDSYETSRSPTGTMLTWLESDLAMNVQPWVIAYWHHPPYSKGSHNSDTEGRLIDMRENALPILENWGVDLVLSGHSHSYERSYLLDSHYGDSSTLNSAIHILDSGDGNPIGDGAYQKPDSIAAIHTGAVYTVAGSSGKVSGGSLNHPAMAVSIASLGSVVIDVTGNRMDVTFIDDNGATIDEFSITKGPDRDPPILADASTADSTHIIIDFNEPLDSVSSQDPSNYSIAGLIISQAEFLTGNRSVRLTTTAMVPDMTYTLVVNNVQDTAGNTILSNSQISFDFIDIRTVSFQDGVQPDATYSGTSDSYLLEVFPDSAHGFETRIEVDGSEPSGTETDKDMLIGWDLSSIPVGAILQSADIDLTVTNSSSGDYACYQILTAWEEPTVTWNEASSGVPWSSPGASSSIDRGSEILCTVSAGSTGPMTVNITAAGLGIIQTWLDAPASNHGMIITGPTVSDGADFHSSESTTLLSRPRLNLTYQIPTDLGNMDPAAGFTWSCNELDCNFTDTSFDSDGAIVSWDWDFGDGNTSIVQHPGHTYATEGDFIVSLTVTDDDGASNTYTDTISVDQLIDPIADFTSSCTELDCVFTDASSDTDGTIVGWSWDLGDGITSTLQNPIHTYTAEGDFTVSLMVIDNDGASDTFSTIVSIDQPINPIADFTFSCSDLDCIFTDMSSDSDGTIIGWLWDFDDTSSSTLQKPSHFYAVAGDYSVRLTVTDNDGLSDMLTSIVSVSEPPSFVDHFAVGELRGSGTVAGSYTDTHSDDGITQSVREVSSRGKKSNRYSYLEKTWEFSITPGALVTLYANAWSSGSSDEDKFVFSWSNDNITFLNLFEVSSTDSNNQQEANIPSDGTLYIRVQDTDRGQGNRALDTIFVDQLYIRTELGNSP